MDVLADLQPEGRLARRLGTGPLIHTTNSPDHSLRASEPLVFCPKRLYKMCGADIAVTARHFAAWLGALVGVVALGRVIIRWLRERPHLDIRARANMSVVPDALGRPIVCVSVTNTGTASTTITMLMGLEFTTWLRRVCFRPERTWVVLIDPALGQPLPRELQPGQQWTSGIRQTHEINRLVARGSLYLGIHRAGSYRRPTLAHVKSAGE